MEVKFSNPHPGVFDSSFFRLCRQLVKISDLLLSDFLFKQNVKIFETTKSALLRDGVVNWTPIIQNIGHTKVGRDAEYRSSKTGLYSSHRSSACGLGPVTGIQAIFFGPIFRHTSSFSSPIFPIQFNFFRPITEYRAQKIIL